MSDYVPTKQERESAEAREALWNALGRRPDELYKIASALTAAEERGRRRGVGELTDAKALLTEIRHELLRMDGGHGSIAELPASLRRASTVARLSNAIRALDAALAPLDSAPVCDNCKRAAAAKDGRTEHGIEIGPCYCATLRAPRDSGKEG